MSVIKLNRFGMTLIECSADECKDCGKVIVKGHDVPAVALCYKRCHDIRKEMEVKS